MVLLTLPSPKEARNQHPLPLLEVRKKLSTFTLEELTNFNAFIKKNKKFKLPAITEYLKKNPSYWGLLFWFLPYPTHLELYLKNFFGEAYYDQEIVQDLLKVNQISLMVQYLNKGPGLNSYLVCLNNTYNSRFSFDSKRILNRWEEFQKLWPEMDFSDLVLGTDLTLFLAGTQKIDPKTQYNYHFQVYSRKTKRALGKIPMYFAKDVTYQLQHHSDLKITLAHYQHLIETPIQILLGQKEVLILDLEEKKIWTTSDHFQTESFFRKDQFEKDTFDPQKYTQFQVRKFQVYLSPTQRDLENSAGSFMNQIHLDVSQSKHPRCYICHQHFNPFLVPERYGHHCYECGLLEYQKRIQKVDLSSLKVYVSGCRIKIGYYSVLRFLRLGSKVIGSTRFPKLAWLNFQKEEDFDQWKDRLTILKTDFKSLHDVHQLIKFLKEEKINVLVNNACQTIRPSSEYLKKLGEAESNLGLEWKDQIALEDSGSDSGLKEKILDLELKSNSEFEVYSGSKIVPFGNTSVLELNRYGDIDDLQGQNSTWFKEIDQVDPVEIVEVTTVNQLVPTLLINQLRPSMANPAFLINVTAIEGQFNISSKDAYHPHTNMAKAAINMMIRTLAEEKNPRVLPYAIDPGFVSGVRERTLITGVTPIQSDDGASRVVDPVVCWFQKNKLTPGKYRHYQLEDW